MAEEQELTLRVVLDDQASAGLNNLQQQMRQLGSGPQAQGMERMRRGSQEAGGAVKQLTEGLGAFGQIATTAAGVATGILAAKVIDLGAAFVSSITDFKGYADAMVSLSQQAYAAGTSMGQFQADVDLMVRSGVSAEAAARQITAFGHAWAEMGDITSETRQKLVAGMQDDPAALIKMQQFLDEAATMTREGAMNAAREFAVGIREYWREQGRPEAYGARWEEDFLRQLGIPDLARVRGMFGEISAARRQLFAEREAGAAAFQTASGEISEAWRDIKTSFQAILVDSPLVQGLWQGMASVMRGIATGLEYVETAMRGLGVSEAFQQLGEDANTWLESMGRQAWDALVDDFQYFVDQVGDNLKTALPESWHESIDMMTEGIQALIDDPSWSNLYTQISRALPESWREALNEMNIQRLIDDPSWANLYASIRTQLPESWQDATDQMAESIQRLIDDPSWSALYAEIRRALPESWRASFDQATTEIQRWMDDIKTYFTDPNWLADATNAVVEFVRGAAESLYDQTIGAAQRAISDMVQRMVQMLPAWARKWIEGGVQAQEAPPPAAEPQQRQPAPGAEVITTQMGGLEPGLGAGEGVVAPIEAPAEAATQATAAPARSWRNLWGLTGGGAAAEARQEGGPIIGGQPYVVGERGPEVIVPQAGGDVASTAELAAWSRGAPDLGPSASGRAGQVGTDRQFLAALQLFNPFGPVARLAGGALSVSDVAGALGRSIQGLGGAQSAEAMGGVMTAGQMGRGIMGALQGVMGRGAGEGQQGEWAGANLSNLSATLDRAATQNVNVNGTGKISVDVNAPAGTRVGAVGEGLFKTTEITRQTQMMFAESGPLAATGIGAGAGVMGGAQG